MTTRPDWDEIWMRFAKSIAERSIDPRNKVGAVIVSEDNTQVLSMGYNGDHAGGPNEVDSLEPGQSGCIHAEINALIKLDYNNPKAKKIDNISHLDALSKQIRALDSTALSMCMDNNVPISVFNIFDKGSLSGILGGNKIGTLITNDGEGAI